MFYVGQSVCRLNYSKCHMKSTVQLNSGRIAVTVSEAAAATSAIQDRPDRGIFFTQPSGKGQQLNLERTAQPSGKGQQLNLERTQHTACNESIWMTMMMVMEVDYLVLIQEQQYKKSMV